MANYVDTALYDFPLAEGAAPRRVGYVVNFSFHIWYKVVQEYMSARARQYGMGELLFRDAQQDLRTQLSAVDELLAQRVDALIVTPVPGPGTEAIVQKARAAGVVLVIEANPVAGMSTMVAICDYDAGVKSGIWAGEYALKSIGDSLAVLDIAYPPLRPCVLRSDGFLDGLRSVVPGAKLAERVNGEAVIETAQRESTRALQRHPEINMMFAMDDESLQGGLLAARELGRSERGIIAVGFGLAGDEAKHHLLHADAWKASLSMFPEWVGARCVDQCVRLLNNQHVPVHDVVPTICVSRDMMTAYFTEHEGRWYPNFNALLAIPREDRCAKI